MTSALQVVKHNDMHNVSTPRATFGGMDLADDEAAASELWTQRVRLLIEQVWRANPKLTQRALAERIGIGETVISHILKDPPRRRIGGENLTAIERATGIRHEFFADPTLVDPDYKQFIGPPARVVVRDEEQPPDSLLVWEARLAPKAYDPQQHRQRLLDSKFRFPIEQAAKWTTVFDLVLDEKPPSAEDAASMKAAEQEADDLGALRPSRKPTKGRHAKG